MIAIKIFFGRLRKVYVWHCKKLQKDVSIVVAIGLFRLPPLLNFSDRFSQNTIFLLLRNLVTASSSVAESNALSLYIILFLLI